MSKSKELIKKSLAHRSFVADAVSLTMHKFGYGDINLAGANSRYKTFTKLEREFKSRIGKTVFPEYKNDKSNVVWVCWLQGFESAPELVKNCVKSIEYHIKDREIIYVTGDNYSDYCDIPSFIVEKWKTGIITNTHFSDILRLALLIQNGGLWMDATVYMTGDLPSYITDGDFFGYRDGFFNCDLINFGNWLIYSKPNNILLAETYNLLLEYWKKYDYIRHYFIFQMFFRMVTDYYPDLWNAVPYYSQMDQHIFSFEFLNAYDEKRFNQLKGISPIHKLTNKIDTSKADNESYFSKMDVLYKQ